MYQETVTEEQRQDTQVSTENGLPKELERKLLILEKELRETKAQITTQDLLPLVTRLNIPPFLGHSEQTTPQRIKTQQIASVWIHVERAMNRIRNKI